MICGARVLALGAILGSLWTGTGDARTSADGGSGTYTTTGTTVFFDLFDAGTTRWQYFVLVGPAGTRFVGAATSAENTARCVPTLPDGRAESIECGPLAPTVMRPGSHLLLVGTMTAPVACGARFELDVSSDGVQPFARGGDLTPAGSCAGALRAVAPPRISGIGRPGAVQAAQGRDRPFPPPHTTPRRRSRPCRRDCHRKRRRGDDRIQERPCPLTADATAGWSRSPAGRRRRSSC